MERVGSPNGTGQRIGWPCAPLTATPGHPAAHASRPAGTLRDLLLRRAPMVPRAFVLVLVFGTALGGTSFLTGCAAQKVVSGWLGGESAPPSADGGQVYYANAAGVSVYSKPSSSSTVVGELALHEKVTRYRVERGYAYVTGEARGVTGWVNNAMLVWRLPAATSAAVPAPAKDDVEKPREAPAEVSAPPVPEPAPPPPVAAEPSPAPSVDAEPAPAPPSTAATKRRSAPNKPTPSIFDPY